MSDGGIVSNVILLFYVCSVALMTDYVISRCKELLSRPKKREYGEDEVVEPPIVTCWIPYIGSAIEMGKDIRAFINRYCGRFDTPVFSATIGGTLCHFVGSPLDAHLAFKPTTALDFSTIGSQFLVRAVGTPPDLVDAAYQDQAGMKKVQSFLQRYIKSPKAMQDNVEASQRILVKKLEELVLMYGRDTASAGSWFRVPLYDMSLRLVFAASVGPLLSEEIATDEMARHFSTWNHSAPLLFANVPSVFLRKAIASREEMVRILKSPLFSESMTEHFKKRKDLYPDPELFARSALSMVFAASGNSIPSVFWMIGNLATEPKALSAVSAEVTKLQTDSTYLSLAELDKMTTIDAIWTETMRFYQASLFPRDIKKDMIVELHHHRPGYQGPKKFRLKEGTRLMGFIGIRHYDADTFAEPTKFVWDRFVPDPKTGKPPVFRMGDTVLEEPVIAFGGGNHKCPGRRFIENEMKSLVANLFSKYEIRIPEGESIPGVDLTTQGAGISHPARDMFIEMRLKQKEN